MMKSIIHFFEIAIIAVKVLVGNDAAKRSLFVCIDPVL